MVVGIPGAGINGLFYLLLSAVMPLEELPRTLRGRSSLARWQAIASLVCLAATVLLTLWGEYWVIERVIGLLQKRFSGVPWVRGAATAARGLAPALLVAPFLVLGAVVLAVFGLGLALRFRAAVAARRRVGAACVLLVLASAPPLDGCVPARAAAVSVPAGYDFRSAVCPSGATKIGGRWFAPDATGAPRFEISADKVNNYPRTIVIDDHTADVVRGHPPGLRVKRINGGEGGI